MYPRESVFLTECYIVCSLGGVERRVHLKYSILFGLFMAYKKGSRRRMKMQPSELTINLDLPTQQGLGDTNRYVDISQLCSLLSRRFYRQGLNWAVKGFTFHNLTGSQGSLQISKLPSTWVMSNAWEKSFRAWSRMIDNATDESGAVSIKGRFLDFKVYADAKHHELGVDYNLLPFVEDGLTGTNIELVPGQWQMSDITIPNAAGTAQDFELIVVGDNEPGVSPATGKNAQAIIQGYSDSRALPAPEDPNVPAAANTNWMVDLFDEGTSQDSAVINMLEITGDNPPYPFEGDVAGTAVTMYPGGAVQAPGMVYHDQVNSTNTTVGNKSHMKGGQFPCGLMRVKYDAELAGGILQIHLVPGSHRGYLCEPMQDM